MAAAKRTVADAIVDHAASSAPSDSGDYRASLRTVVSGDTTAAASSDFAAHLIEFGSVNNPPHAPLRGAVRALGLRLEEAPPP